MRQQSGQGVTAKACNPKSKVLVVTHCSILLTFFRALYRRLIYGNNQKIRQYVVDIGS